MRIAYFDPTSGASGDMILGALIDAGASLTRIQDGLKPLGLPGYRLTAERVVRGPLAGTKADVLVEDGQPRRDWREIRALLQGSALPGPIKERALAVFGRLAEAEATAHGTEVEEVHFHEVGAVDAIVDICGACIALAELGVEQVWSGPPRLGAGYVQTDHGLIPVPAPATAALLAAAGAPSLTDFPGGVAVQAELLTPTGAALLTTLARFGSPAFAPSAIGYGFGTKELPWPNALRVWIGDMAEPMADRSEEAKGELLIETNIDDMNPQHYDLLLERLFAAGADDAWLAPIIMKKGRPAVQVSVLCAAARKRDLASTLINESTTLGMRIVPVERIKAERIITTETTRWGEVRIKLRGWQGRVIDAMPEHDDCSAIARANDVPIREVWQEARRIGESSIGLRLTAEGALPERR